MTETAAKSNESTEGREVQANTNLASLLLVERLQEGLFTALLGGFRVVGV
jgi:hypothetical protein